MAIVKSNTLLGTTPPIQTIDCGVVTVREKVALTAAQVAANNVVEMAILPAGCVPIGYVLDSDDMDTATGLTMDLGVVNAGETAISAAAADGGAKWVTASTLGQAGGILLHTASKAAYDILGAVTPVDFDRKIGVVFPAVGTSAAGNLRLELSYAAAR